MILLKDKNGNKVNFELTKFPDGTSQAWKVENFETLNSVEIVWIFESESEFMPVMQLLTLFDEKEAELTIPFLPYARQDKKVSNTSTFAKDVFEYMLLAMGVDYINTFDVHSQSVLIEYRNILGTNDFHKSVFEHHYVVYPDAGAVERYKNNGLSFIYADKVRNQLTGQIESIKLNRPVRMQGANFLIIDDICDGGGTFIPLVKTLKEFGADQVDLCVSHGIFSKGVDILFDAGIDKIYTTNSLVANEWRQGKDPRIHITKIIETHLDTGIKKMSRYERKMV